MINNLLARATIGQPTPEVGMGATRLLYSDRRAATITEVRVKYGETYITVQDDHTRVIAGSGHDGSAEYEYSPNPRGSIRHFKATLPDGAWIEVTWNNATKRWNRVKSSNGLRIGERDEYRDPSM
jgi:hypothetical protein